GGELGLCALPLLGGALAFRHVTNHLAEPDEFAVLVAQRCDHDARPKAAAVFAHPPGLLFIASPPPGYLEFSFRGALGLRVGRMEDADVLTKDLLSGVATELLRTAIPACDVPGHIQGVHRIIGDIVKKESETLLADKEGARGLMLRGHVD